MPQNDENVFLGQKVVFCGHKKNYDADRKSPGFFYQRYQGSKVFNCWKFQRGWRRSP